jgi:hypothetical protein
MHMATRTARPPAQQTAAEPASLAPAGRPNPPPERPPRPNLQHNRLPLSRHGKGASHTGGCEIPLNPDTGGVPRGALGGGRTVG